MDSRFPPIDAFIAGAEKAGTTSLGFYLSQHPDVHSHFKDPDSSSRKVVEFDAFVAGSKFTEDVISRKFLDAFERFPGEGEITIAKNVNIMTDEDGARRLYAHAPQCRIITCLRDPVARAYSSYWYQRFRGEESHRSFEEALEYEMASQGDAEIPIHVRYLERGRYAYQLRNLQSLFGSERLHVVFFEEMAESPDTVANRVFSFLGLSPFEVKSPTVRNPGRMVRSPHLARIANRNNVLKSFARHLISEDGRRRAYQWFRLRNSKVERPPQMKRETRQFLLEYFARYNRDLSELLGRDLPGWNG